MIICESKDICKQKECYHIKPHEVSGEADNYCTTNPCDPLVSGKALENYCAGSVCVDDFIFKMRKVLERHNANM